MPDHRPSLSFWLMPFAVAARASEAALTSFARLLDEDAGPPAAAPEWTTPSRVRLELPGLIVREFSGAEPGALPFLVVTPLALHGAVIADLAPGHSVVERLLAEGIAPLALVEWRSASPQMKHLSIDSYLAELSVAIDDLGGRANLIGLCQGGWLALMLAARFPDKVHSLVVAGAPVDLDACPSRITEATRASAPEMFDALIEAGDGLVIGQRMRSFWPLSDEDADGIARILQVEDPPPALIERFKTWDAFTLDMPGAYYRETVEELFRRNALAKGTFRALGRAIALSDIGAPLMVLAGDQDEVVPPAQALAATRLVGTPANAIRSLLATAPHLGLFMGAEVLAGPWREIAAFLHRHGQTNEAPGGARRGPARA